MQTSLFKIIAIMLPILLGLAAFIMSYITDKKDEEKLIELIQNFREDKA